MTTRSRRLTASLLVTGALLAGCTTGPPDPPAATTPAASGPAAFTPERLESLAAALPQQAGKDLAASRLADGLVPPTNRWFSGLVFGASPQPVYPLPLSFALTTSGFTLGRPPVTTTAKTIMGTHTPEVDLTFATAPDWRVDAYDEASVTLGSAAGKIVLVQGSPYVAFTASGPQTLTSRTPLTPAGAGTWSLTGAGVTYGVTGAGVTASGSTLTAPDGARLSLFAVPDGGTLGALAALASAEVVGTAATYAASQDSVTTTLAYRTADGSPTAFAALPHQAKNLVAAGATCDLGTYPSAYGTLTVCRGTALSWRSPTYEARLSLDISGLADAEADELRAAVKKDAAAVRPYPADTYFGGKALQRDASLYVLARDLGLTAEADALRQKVTAQLRTWAEPDGCSTREAFCFVYDTANRGVVGKTASFGSDEFNDHHFHYGYFLYTGAIMGADDPELAADLAPVLDALAADIAADADSDRFPVRRTFDVYASHAWASGTSPFADGNNQESSSEAVNAWAGVTLWGRVSGNAGLEAEGAWLHALEAQAARAYWTDFDRADPVYDGFEHSIVPLNFGGKRDYATWFSAEPAAALAILVLPGSPSSDHLAGDPERIRANVAEAVGSKGFTQQYGDFLLLYSALAGGADADRALATARTLADATLDDGLTFSYLLAWILTAG